MMKRAALLLPLCLVAVACSGPTETPASAEPSTEAAPAVEPAAPAAEPVPEPATEAEPAAEPAPETAPKAKIVLFNATCPGGIEVHADQGGPVFINGTEAKYASFSETYYEANDAASGVTVSVATNTDGTLSVSYSAPGGANGVCTLAQ